MSTYYDRQAQRTAASGEAERQLAQADELRAATELSREQGREDLADRRAKRRAQARTEADRRRAARRRERDERRQKKIARRKTERETKAVERQGWRKRAMDRVRRNIPFLVAGTAMGSPIVIAWNGQLAFARDVMHLGALAPALPIALEGAVWYLAWLTHTAIKAKLPTGRYRLFTWGFACMAAGMNFWHGRQAYGSDGIQAGVTLAISSLLGIALWELTATLVTQAGTGRTAAELRTALWRKIRYPRLSWAAMSIRAAHSCGAEQAWRSAWRDRFGVEPEAGRRERRLAKAIMKASAKADLEAAKDGRLKFVDGVILGRPIPSVPITRSDRFSAGEPRSIDVHVAVNPVDRSTVTAPGADRSIEGEVLQNRRSIEPPRGASIDLTQNRDRSMGGGGSTSALDSHGRGGSIDRGVQASIEAGRTGGEGLGRLADLLRPVPSTSDAGDESIDPQPREAGETSDELAPRRRPKTGAKADRSTGASKEGTTGSVPRRSDRRGRRKSFEEHREVLKSMIGSGHIDPDAATTELVRTTLQCAPWVARELFKELPQLSQEASA